MEKIMEQFHINGKQIEVPVLHAKPEELIPAFRVGNETIYRIGKEFWVKMVNADNYSNLLSLRQYPCDVLEDTDEEIVAEVSKRIEKEMSCEGTIYTRVCEPRYYIGSHPHLRLIEETHSIEQARWVDKCGFRVYNAYEFEKAQQVAQMITFLVHEKPKGEDKFPTPHIQVLESGYQPTIGGNPVPGRLLTQPDLKKLNDLDLEFQSGVTDYIYTLQDTSVFRCAYDEIFKIVVGERQQDSYGDRENAVWKHLELSGDVYEKTDDEIDGELVERITDTIRTCDVREIHYAAAQVIGLNPKMPFQMPKTPEASEEEIPFDTVRESVKDYLEFSHLTSKVWAFNLAFEQITRQQIDIIAAVAGCCDTEVIYLAADCVLGTNPDLLSDPATTDAKEDGDESPSDGYGKAMIFTSPRGKQIRFDSWGDTTDENCNQFYWVGMCPRCHNKYRSILGNRASKDGSGSCYVKGCEYETDYHVDFEAKDVTFVTDFETVPGSFEYGCYHFLPVGTFKEKDFQKLVKHLRTDPELGVCASGYAYPCKVLYSHKSFYDASTVKSADVFRCLENGKNYTACQNDLKLFEGEYLPLGLEWD